MTKQNMEEITWTNCADNIPLDDTEIFVRNINDHCEFVITPANEIWYDVAEGNLSDWEWTEYTKEKWEELNK